MSLTDNNKNVEALMLGPLNEKKNDHPKDLSITKRIDILFRSNVHVFPLLTAIMVPVICSITYITTIRFYPTMNPILPYISDTGALPPAAAFFSMMMDIGVGFFLLGTYYRYKMIRYVIKEQIPHSFSTASKSPETINFYQRLNSYALCISFVVAFGGFSVGNIRMNEHINVHLVAAFVCFFPCLTYFYLQARISQWMYEHNLESRPISMWITLFVGGCGLVTFTVFAYLSVKMALRKNTRNNSWRMSWDETKPGYVMHCISSLGEWIAVNTLTPGSLCLFNRMRKFQHFDKV